MSRESPETYGKLVKRFRRPPTVGKTKSKAVQQTYGEGVKGEGIEAGGILRVTSLTYPVLQVFGCVPLETDGQDAPWRGADPGLE